ncbi:MAG: hypothetical protein ACRENK_08680 [Gemmatimonadaceae bacterium]
MNISGYYGADNELRGVFRGLGAISPASARSVKDLQLDAASFDRLLRRGVIREGSPGKFYLYEPPPAPSRLLRQLIFFVIVILLPVAIIQFCPRVP